MHSGGSALEKPARAAQFADTKTNTAGAEVWEVGEGQGRGVVAWRCNFDWEAAWRYTLHSTFHSGGQRFWSARLCNAAEMLSSLVAGSDELVVPADAVLIAGTCIVDESVLTGESTPQWKSPLSAAISSGIARNSALDVEKRDKAHILFGGTKVLQHTGDKGWQLKYADGAKSSWHGPAFAETRTAVDLPHQCMCMSSTNTLTIESLYCFCWLLKATLGTAT